MRAAALPSPSSDEGRHRAQMDSSSYCGESTCSVSFSDIDQSNEMLNADNASLRDRLYELERKVISQEDELVCLRSSTADLLRRVSLLEQSSSSQNPAQNGIQSSQSPDVFSRLSGGAHHSAERQRLGVSKGFSQSTYNLRSYNNTSTPLVNGHRTTSPSPIRRISVESSESNGIDQGTRPGLPRRYARNGVGKPNIVNVSTGRSTKGSPMRKWVSSVDMKENNSTNVSPVFSNHADASGAAPSPGTSLHKAKSTARFGSLSSLAASHRSLSQLGHNYRDPVYLADQRALQVFIRGKSAVLAAPSSTSNIDPLREVEPPRIAAALEWVHGYRGKDSRHNLHEMPTGEMVYFAGAVVVLHNPEEGTQRHYTQHTSEIKCIAIHPNKLLVATGQSSRHSPEKKILNEHRSPICSPADLDNILESDQTQAHIRIWDSVTLQTLYSLGVGDASFERGISCVAFSRFDGGVLLAAVDESYEHTLSVWDWQRCRKITETKGANDQVFACEFHPYMKSVLVSFGKSHFNFWNFECGTLSKKAVVFEGRDKPKMVLSMCFMENGLVVSGDSNGTISLWDTKSLKIVKQAFKVHDGGVWALCAAGGGRIISGGKDRAVIEWNAHDLVRIRGPVVLAEDAGIIRTIAPAKGSMFLIGTTRNAILQGDMKNGFHYLVQGHSDELWALSVHPSLPQFITGSIDGTLRLWDSLSRSIVWSAQLQEGIACLHFHPSGKIFVVGSVMGSWTAYDTSTRNPIQTANESAHSISSIRFSPDGKLLAVATKEPQFYIYSLIDSMRRFTKMTAFPVTASFITTIDWSSDSLFLRTNNNDLEQQLWCVTNGRIADVAKVRDIIWNSSRCIVSFENGCIGQSVPGIMAVERSPDSSFVAAAVDNGSIRFYQYPTTSVMAAYKEIFGHSNFIGNVAFLESRLISIGAKDSAIFQWRL